MSATKTPIFTGANNEAACRAVMSKLKMKGEWLTELHNKVNKSLELIEALIVKNPTDENKILLLQTMELYERDKCVAEYEEAVIKKDEDSYDIWDADGNPVFVKDNKGNIKYETVKIERYINCTDWTVSITRAKKVRVHLNAEAVESLTKQYSNIKHIKDFKVY